MRRTLLAFALLGCGLAQAQDPGPLAGTAEAAGPTLETPSAQNGVTAQADVPRKPISLDDQLFFRDQAVLNRDIRLLKLRLEKRELEREIFEEPKKQEADSASPRGPQPIIAINPTAAPVATPPPAAPVKPAGPGVRLLSIYGSEPDYRADLSIGAARVTVSPGDTLPDGWRVTAVERMEVMLRKGAKPHVLRLGE